MNVHHVSPVSSGGRVLFVFLCKCARGLRLRLLRDREENAVGSFGAERRVGVGRGLQSNSLCVFGGCGIK